MGDQRYDIAFSTAGFWHIADLEDALRRMADAGITAVEFFPYPPHLDLETFDTAAQHRVRRLMDDLGQRCASVNFSMELNLMSLHPGLRSLAMAEFKRALEIGAILGAPCMVLPSGRRHVLMPAPEAQARAQLQSAVRELAKYGAGLGVAVALETLPFDLLSTGQAMVDVVREIDHPNLGICYDCTNTLPFEDPAKGVQACGDLLLLAHVSDSWRSSWAHTSPGRGEVDFAAFADGLREMGYRGDVVLELMDGEDPTPRLATDLKFLADAGFRN